jgi:hypothetical protein
MRLALSDGEGANMEHVRYFLLSHIQDYVTYAAHRRQHFFDL